MRYRHMSKMKSNYFMKKQIPFLGFSCSPRTGKRDRNDYMLYTY